MTSPTVDRRQGLVGNTPIKAPVDFATTANIVLAGEQIVDGLQSAASRVLVKSQTDPTQNGIYDTNTAAWTRSFDADGSYDLAQGSLVLVNSGATQAGSLFVLDTTGPVIGQTSLDWRNFQPENTVNLFQYMTLAQQLDVMNGTLQYDHAFAFDAAIASGRPVYVPKGPDWLYNIGHQINVPSNSTIYGERPNLRLANGINEHVFRVEDGATNVEIRGMVIDGNKANNPTGGHGIATGGTGATSVRVFNNYIFNCNNNGIYFGGTSILTSEAVGNYSTGNNLAGITMDANCQFMKLDGNFTWDNGTHGTGIIGVATDCSISYNVSWNNGQAVPSADNLTGYNASNARLSIVGNISLGGLNNGIHFGGNFITYAGNVSRGATQYGLMHQSSGSPPAVSNGVTMTGNAVTASFGAAGIFIGVCNSGVVAGNVSNSNSNHGIEADQCSNLTFSGNTARSNVGSGLRFPSASANFTVVGNTCTDNGADGLRYDQLNTSTITANVFRTNVGAGVNCSGTDFSNVFSANVIKDNAAGPVAGTFDPSTVWGTNNTDGSSNLASAATLVLPVWTNVFNVTGATSITSIAPSWPGRQVVLILANGLTVTKGNNIKSASDFTGVGGFSSFSLAELSANWIECGRSLN